MAFLGAGLSQAVAQASDSSSGQQSSAANAASGQNAAAPRFDIMEFVVDGNTVLSTSDIEEAVYSFMGEQRTANDVDAAREALEGVYKAQGYQTVQVAI